MGCGICGDEKRTREPVQYWSPDDGWIIGALCDACFKGCGRVKPDPSDYAWDKRADAPDDSGTDLDTSDAFLDW